jgi:hypothetical protein
MCASIQLSLDYPNIDMNILVADIQRYEANAYIFLIKREFCVLFFVIFVVLDVTRKVKF